MPGHVKTSLMGPSLNIPVRNGRLALGTWQGEYYVGLYKFCSFSLLSKPYSIECHLNLCTKQSTGVYLNEHREQGGYGGGHTRKIVITLQGQG